MPYQTAVVFLNKWRIIKMSISNHWVFKNQLPSFATYRNSILGACVDDRLKQAVKLGHVLLCFHQQFLYLLLHGKHNGCIYLLLEKQTIIIIQRLRFVHGCNNIIKFTDDTTVLGRITGGNESAYKDEVKHLVMWRDNNNLVLDTQKTKRDHYGLQAGKEPQTRSHCHQCRDEERVGNMSSFKFLHTHNS